LDKHDAANWYVNNDETETDQSDWRVFIQTEYLEVEKGDDEFDNEDDEGNETTPLYMAIFEKDVLNEKTGYIVYKWILEMEKMGLHQTQEILVENGYGIVELKTDAIRYKFNGKPKFGHSDYYYGDAKTIPKYRDDDNNKVIACKGHCYTRTGELNIYHRTGTSQMNMMTLTRNSNELLNSIKEP
jgi:hypothetical protein